MARYKMLSQDGYPRYYGIFVGEIYDETFIAPGRPKGQTIGQLAKKYPLDWGLVIEKQVTFPRQMVIWEYGAKTIQTVLAYVPNRTKPWITREGAHCNATEISTINLPKIDGYDGVMNQHKIITYGCTKLHSDQFDYIKLFNSVKSNQEWGMYNELRRIQSITLDSGVVITINQIEEVYNYCHQK